MAIVINRFDGGEVDFLSARDLEDNQFQSFQFMRPDRITRAVRSLSDGGGIVTSIANSHYLPGQGFYQIRTEWDDSGTPRQASTLFYIGARIVDSVGAWEINIHRAKAVSGSGSGAWGTEFIDETTAKGGWERATSSRLVQGATDITFTASTNRISGSANLANYEVGEIIRVFNTTSNDGYFTVKTKEPAANSVDVVEGLTDEASVSAYIYPLPIISMYAINGALRLSNGNFYDTTHDSLWYGHIKRDFWGQGVTYGSNGGRFEQPAMAEAYNNWKLQDQELVAPTIIAGARTGQATSAANQVAIHIAGAHHEFKELMPNSIDRTFTGGGTAWANVDLNAFNETTDLTITASAADQYCTCPVASAPMTAAKKYKLQFDVANLISTFTVQDFTGVQKFGTVRANGKEQSIKFTVNTSITGGLRLVADTDDASADFDNFSLSSIDWPEKAVDAEWNERDRVAFTYVYDFVQESELSRAANGEIGLPMGTIIGEEMARAFMVEAYTGAAQASWNRRITAIRLYYQFHDDPDWYEVVTLNINKGWSESELVFAAENTGYWIPIVDENGVDHTGTTDAAGGSATTINDVAHGLDTNDMLYVLNTATIEPDSLITKPSAIPNANSITLPVAMVDSLGVNPASYNSLDWFAGTYSTTAVATFYIPFTGEKAFTYNTNTGRAAKVELPAVRWAASDTDGHSVLIGNIDYTDENGQTVRERGRVAESSPGMPDTFPLTVTKDIGLYTGDKVIAIRYYNGNWWVMMERNTIVLQPRTLRKLAHYTGIGCKWAHAHVITPSGLAMADRDGITLLPSGKELTFPRRDSYQALTFFEPIMTYSRDYRKLFFVPDTRAASGTRLTLWSYSFDLDAWNREDMTIEYGPSNFVDMGENDEPVFATANSYAAGGSWLVGELRASGGTSIESDLKTKEYHNGTPYLNKQFGTGHISYKSTSQELYVDVFLDGNSIAHKTVELPASSNMTNAEVSLNVNCKLISFAFRSTASDLEIEEFIVPEDQIILQA